ncbi:hypothetical protein B0T25DRAFT_124271 [Lasiosphaeria hispida]|uniref:Uncharacterized protein n=1 Tax=Lasiosphaeria hispida TaxID=260671 RepID=A0AAJ0MIF1_9PEZI|nr:hypothetical protein B0T25DRAFT_124271 [Lasiosphaeria hispida]
MTDWLVARSLLTSFRDPSCQQWGRSAIVFLLLWFACGRLGAQATSYMLHCMCWFGVWPISFPPPRQLFRLVFCALSAAFSCNCTGWSASQAADVGVVGDWDCVDSGWSNGKGPTSFRLACCCVAHPKCCV